MAATATTYADDRVAAVSRAVGGPAADEQLVVRLYGEDFDTLRGTADEVRTLLTTVPGVLAPRVEAQSSEPTVQITVDLAAAERHGLRPGDVRREASTLISGLTVGSLYEDQKIFDVVVWGGPATRGTPPAINDLLIDTPSGDRVRLGDVATVQVAPAPTVIKHDNISRSLDVTAQVAATSGDVTSEVGRRVAALPMPTEYHAEVLADAQAQLDLRWRIAGLALAVAIGIFLLLQAAFSSWRSAAVS